MSELAAHNSPRLVGGSADMVAQKAGLPALNFMKLKQEGGDAAVSTRQGAPPDTQSL